MQPHAPGRCCNLNLKLLYHEGQVSEKRTIHLFPVGLALFLFFDTSNSGTMELAAVGAEC